MQDYDLCTDAEFDNILGELMNRNPATALLSVPGVYEAVREHFNNDVLDVWAKRNRARIQRQSMDRRGFEHDANAGVYRMWLAPRLSLVVADYNGSMPDIEDDDIYISLVLECTSDGDETLSETDCALSDL